MTMASKLLQIARKGFRFSGAGGGGYGYGWSDPFFGMFRLLPSADHDYRRDAGLLWENSIVKACIDWQADTFPQAPLIVTEPNKDGKRTTVFNHPAVNLFSEPNEWYSGNNLWRATLTSLACDGNAYWFKLRGPHREVIGFSYIPHWQIFARWPIDGSKFISHYDYIPTGQTVITLKTEDVIHFREGLDPLNIRRGLSRFGAVLREICTENEAATFSAAMLRNSGVTSVIIMPEKDEPELGETDRRKISDLWSEKFSRDRAGEPFVSSGRLDIKNPGWSPEQMVLDKIRGVPVSRICAAFGIDPLVLGLPSETNSTYGNRREAQDGAWESCLIPRHMLTSDELNRSLRGEILGMSDAQRFERDYSDVRALQEDVAAKWKRVVDAYKNGVIMRKDALRILGQPYEESADAVYFTDILKEIASMRGAAFGSDSGDNKKALDQGIEEGYIIPESLLLTGRTGVGVHG